ncbi:MAG: transketolase [Sphaerochaetaceae bacterium]
MKNIRELEAVATKIRKNIIEMSYLCKRAAHPGPALSCADIVAALYFRFMDVDSENPLKFDRDRFILSKGHASPVIYATLCEKGFFEKKEFNLLRHPGGILQGHPTFGSTPGVDMTTGSLGNGLGIGLGMAYYLKLKNQKSKVYVILGDGELNEGTVWEAIMYAPVKKLNNLIAFVDKNGFQSSGPCNDILPQRCFLEQFRSFGWDAIEIDGHNMNQIIDAIETANNSVDKPTVIIANTVKGKGVSFMENDNSWHQKILSEELYEKALSELSGV